LAYRERALSKPNRERATINRAAARGEFRHCHTSRSGCSRHPRAEIAPAAGFAPYETGFAFSLCMPSTQNQRAAKLRIHPSSRCDSRQEMATGFECRRRFDTGREKCRNSVTLIQDRCLTKAKLFCSNQLLHSRLD
jgi:hypothetical protein